MPVLVTGASGFLGGRLAQTLASRGEQARVLARPGAGLSHLSGLPFEVIRGTLSDAECLAAAVENVTRIYHCAACSTDWAPWRVYYEANVEGLRNLLAAARRATGLERFLHVSTTDVYGYPQAPCDETHALVDTGLPYNRSKCLAERTVWESGLPVTVVRPATIFGPRGKAFTTDIAAVIRSGMMAVIDGGRSRGGFCYVDNAVDAILSAASAPCAIGRAYNVADGTGATWRDYVDALAAGLGCRRPWIDLPRAGAFALALLMEAPHRCLRLPGRPLLTRHAVSLLSRDQEFTAGRARRELGWAPAVSFEEGLRRSIEWLKASSPPGTACAEAHSPRRCS
jgi:nucleoside-diphosphate-sugar epimerase